MGLASGPGGGSGPRNPGKRRLDNRIIVLQVLLAALVGTLLLRLTWMQLAGGSEFAQAAENNRIRDVVTPAPRGLILDQLGRPIVASRSSLTVSVDRAELAQQPEGGKAVLTALAGQLGTSYEAIAQRMKPCGTPGASPQPDCWNGPPEQPVVVADDVDRSIGLSLLERRAQFPGVTTALDPTRAYPHPYGVNAAHLAGYLGPVTEEEVRDLGEDLGIARTDVIGRAGLEREYDSQLRGRPGVRKVSVDRSGAAAAVLSDQPPVPGLNLVTSIDARLQAVVEEQLAAAVQRARDQGLAGDAGAAVVLDTQNGRVLALASYPTYDPKIWVGGIAKSEYDRLTDPKQGTPLLSRVTQGLYAPASTFKVISASAAINAGSPLNGYYPCPAALDIGGQAFHNYESEAHGSITLAQALQVSCDTVFYGLAFKLWQRDGGTRPSGTPAEHMVNTARGFGLGEQTGIDLPGEYAGRVVGRDTKKAMYAEMRDAYCLRAKNGYPEVEDRERAELLKSYARDFCLEGDQYRAGDAVNFAIGQGDTVTTPLQMAEIYSAIANGGTLYRPQLARALVDQAGAVQQEFTPAVNGQLPISPTTISYLQQALAGTVVKGTARGAFAGFPLNQVGGLAAKTGTGEVVGKDPTSWFASYAPAASPRYAVVFMVSQGGTGAGTSGPSVRAVYEALFGIKGSSVDPARSVLAGGAPADAIPAPNPDGHGAPDSSGAPAPAPSPADFADRRRRPGDGPVRPASPTARPGPTGPPGESVTGPVTQASPNAPPRAPARGESAATPEPATSGRG